MKPYFIIAWVLFALGGGALVYGGEGARAAESPGTSSRETQSADTETGAHGAHRGEGDRGGMGRHGEGGGHSGMMGGHGEGHGGMMGGHGGMMMGGHGEGGGMKSHMENMEAHMGEMHHRLEEVEQRLQHIETMLEQLLKR
jgi:hypothetical protein